MDKFARAFQALKTYWGWNKYYWYPLAPTYRQDIIACDCRLMQQLLPEIEFKIFLATFFRGKKVYVFQEYNTAYLTTSVTHFGYWHSELYIAETNLQHVVYWSHEGTVALGGRRLIKSFKTQFPNYQEMLCDWGAGTLEPNENSIC